jgi:hypothetical protein
MATQTMASPLEQKLLFFSSVKPKKSEKTKSSSYHLETLDKLSKTSPRTKLQSHQTIASDWKTEPFRIPVTSSWDLPLPSDQVSVLLRGFQPQGRHDKWFVYADKPDENGIATLHTFQSWTGFKLAEVTIEIPSSNASTKPPRITQITWESDEEVVSGNSEERAKQNIRELYTWVLAKQPPLEGTMREETSFAVKANSRRSPLVNRLSEFGAAISPPAPPNSYNSSSRIVNLQLLDVATRPAVFYCPSSP